MYKVCGYKDGRVIYTDHSLLKDAIDHCLKTEYDVVRTILYVREIPEPIVNILDLIAEKDDVYAVFHNNASRGRVEIEDDSFLPLCTHLKLTNVVVCPSRNH
jgi:hypothetical protein